MHEVSLVENIVALVEDERRKQDFIRVRIVRLKLGVLGHVEPEALRFCFDAVTHGTVAEGARLEIEMVAGQGWCVRCRSAVIVSDWFAVCPVCGDDGLSVTGGGDLRLAELEVE
jgi:hydrogenase nickel incorporation protein HypA/HybF